MRNMLEPLLSPLGRREAARPDATAVPLFATNGWVEALPGPSPRVAVNDRDSGFLVVLTKRLDALNWEHRVLRSTPSLELIVRMEVNVVIVDLGVLGSRCWQWLEEISSLSPNVAIVVCAGSSTVADRVRALRLGADDWLGKPCHPQELIARVHAVLRRQRRIDRSDPRDRNPIVAGELEIHSNLYQVFFRGQSVNLTRREFELIELLASHEGCALEREFIYESLWGHAMMPGDRSVDVFVRKVRQKLEVASPDWQFIHTHIAVGYSFDAVALCEVESAVG